ncbi:hypothetical protein ACEYW6_33380 [Nostoc sp. UIC 10607]
MMLKFWVVVLTRMSVPAAPEEGDINNALVVGAGVRISECVVWVPDVWFVNDVF